MQFWSVIPQITETDTKLSKSSHLKQVSSAFFHKSDGRVIARSRGACQISKQYDNYNIQPRIFEIS